MDRKKIQEKVVSTYSNASHVKANTGLFIMVRKFRCTVRMVRLYTYICIILDYIHSACTQMLYITYQTNAHILTCLRIISAILSNFGEKIKVIVYANQAKSVSAVTTLIKYVFSFEFPHKLLMSLICPVSITFQNGGVFSVPSMNKKREI